MSQMLRWMAAAAAALCATAPAWALYKVVGPDGKVTYTDRPPTSAQGNAVPLRSDGRAAAAAGADAANADGLPYVLRTASTRFPVTLYTTPECEPCAQGRSLLKARGVPFRERIAATESDYAAWKQQLGAVRPPTLMVGGQRLEGYESQTWHNTLDAAGYPRESVLPAGWRAPAPQTLTPAAQAPAATAADSRIDAPPTVPAPAAAEPASGGIRF
jgi:glutaredoxin